MQGNPVGDGGDVPEDRRGLGATIKKQQSKGAEHGKQHVRAPTSGLETYRKRRETTGADSLDNWASRAQVRLHARGRGVLKRGIKTVKNSNGKNTPSGPPGPTHERRGVSGAQRVYQWLGQ